MSLQHFFFSEIMSAVSQEQKPKAPCRQNSPNRRCVMQAFYFCAEKIKKTVATKRNDFSPYILQTSLVFLTLELFPDLL